MSEKKFTPGPWVADSESLLAMKGHDTLASIYTSGTVSAEEASANANLIAAAPELLESLENVLKLINCHEMRNCPHVKEDGGCGGEDEDCDWLINSKEAIKKAYGETK